MSLRIRCIFKVKLLQTFGIQAITLYPFIIFSTSRDQVSRGLFRHELEHIYQVKRLGWWRLYFNYLKYYFQLRFQGMNHFNAYWKIPYEIEARSSEAMELSEAELAMYLGTSKSSEMS